MDEADLLLWRIDRLEAAKDQFFGGNKADLGRALGWADGSYVGQMLRGSRPITEKLIRKIEGVINRPGWFDPGSVEFGKKDELRRELLTRDVPDHVLTTFLEAVRQYPPRQTGT